MPIGSEDLTPPMGIMLPTNKPPHVMIVVAHSSVSPGVVIDDGNNLPVKEYEISKRASIAALRALSNDFHVSYLHVGPVLGDTHYLPLKVDEVNAVQPDIALEIHCNSGPPTANYREVICWPNSSKSARAGLLVAQALTEKFINLRPCKARDNSVAADQHLLYFLARTQVPAIIVEGFFLSNPDHRKLLTSQGGAEEYGSAVAAGLRNYLNELRAARPATT